MCVITTHLLKKPLNAPSIIFTTFVFFSNFFAKIGFIGLFIFNKPVNIALLNGVLNIHPWGIYILYSCLIYVYLNFLKNQTKKKIIFNFFFKNFIKFFYLFTISLSILLGGYWAFQELSWGGWWNWDVVELISFLFFYLVVLYLHKKYDGFVYIKNFNSLVMVAILLSLLIVKFNVTPSIHSFIDSNKHKVLLYRHFTMCYIVMLAFFVFLKIRVYNKTTTTLLLKTYYNTTINIFMVVFVFFIQVFSQFFLKNTAVDYLHILGFVFIVFYIYLKLFFKNRGGWQTNLQKNKHYNLKFFMIILFFLKIYFCNYFIYIELLENTHNINNQYTINNNFFKKIKDYSDLWSLNNLNIYNLNLESSVHFFKNYIIFLNNFFIKTVNVNNNTVLLIFSNLFLVLIVTYLTYFFKKKIKTTVVQ